MHTEGALKAAREKKHMSHNKGKLTKVTADFSMEIS